MHRFVQCDEQLIDSDTFSEKQSGKYLTVNEKSENFILCTLAVNISFTISGDLLMKGYYRHLVVFSDHSFQQVFLPLTRIRIDKEANKIF